MHIRIFLSGEKKETIILKGKDAKGLLGLNDGTTAEKRRNFLFLFSLFTHVTGKHEAHGGSERNKRQRGEYAVTVIAKDA